MTVETAHYKPIIQKYVDAGFVLIPLNGKRPTIKKWQEEDYNPFLDALSFRYNYGVVLRDEDLVIDYDPRSKKDNDRPLERLRKDLGIDVETFIVETGGGGLHIYFKKPNDFKITKHLKEYPGLEFLSRVGYVVGAGCIHPDTKKVYEVKNNSPIEIKAAPQVLLDLIKALPAGSLSPGLEAYADDEQSIDRYLIYLKTAAPSAVEGAYGDNTTFKVACRGRDFGLSPGKTLELMLENWNASCSPPWLPQGLQQKVMHAYRYNSEKPGIKHPTADFDVVEKEISLSFDRDFNAKTPLKKTLINVEGHFLAPFGFLVMKNFKSAKSDLCNLLRYNLFTKDIEFKRPAPWHVMGHSSDMWSDDDAICCKLYLAKERGFEPSISLIHEAAVVIARQDTYHPVRDYLQALAWDGRGRVDNWLAEYAGADDNEYVRVVGAKTLLAAVSRVFVPGCKFDYMLVLEGDQGTGKSTLCGILAGAWFGDLVLDTHNKDTIDAMRGKWIIEVSEMECTRRTETQALKAFVSRQVDRVRLAYARTSVDFQRQCIFVGTINPEADGGYLRDTTGNRRFWPVLTRRINLKDLLKDRDQIWAEVVYKYKQGVRLYIEDVKVNKLAMAEANERRVKDPWDLAVTTWVERPDLEGYRRDRLTSAMVFEAAIGGTTRNFTRKEQIRISQILKDHNWESGIMRVPGYDSPVRAYKRPMSDGENRHFIGNIDTNIID